MNEEENKLAQKRVEVYQKFQREFMEKFYYRDPMFRNVFEMMIRDTDPYTIIEKLIEDRAKLVQHMEVMIAQTPIYKIIPKEPL